MLDFNQTPASYASFRLHGFNYFAGRAGRRQSPITLSNDLQHPTLGSRDRKYVEYRRSGLNSGGKQLLIRLGCFFRG